VWVIDPDVTELVSVEKLTEELLTAPPLVIAEVKREIERLSEDIASTADGTGDVSRMVAAFADENCRAARADYLARWDRDAELLDDGMGEPDWAVPQLEAVRGPDHRLNATADTIALVGRRVVALGAARLTAVLVVGDRLGRNQSHPPSLPSSTDRPLHAPPTAEPNSS
jgi:hypothetical protein